MTIDDQRSASDCESSHDVTGVVLEIEEFGVHDGPGIRVVVFLKGCPLRCTWCHNPESLDFGVQELPDEITCPNCGQRCLTVGTCSHCGAEVPSRTRMVGEEMTAHTLAERLKGYESVFNSSGGGVTFSGGEPLAQAEFLTAVTSIIKPIHVAVETSGFAPAPVFTSVVDAMDLVMIDIKHTDPEVHRRFTGHSNRRILDNLAILCAGQTPFKVRIPLIPGVNDDAENLEATARLIAGAPALRGVELLPYNTMAPAKYPRAGHVFDPGFDTTKRPHVDLDVFDRYEIPCEVL